jgi:hypothetical protein
MRLNAWLACVAFAFLARSRATGWTSDPEYPFWADGFLHG